jgi:hypothetical protein
VNKKLQDTTTSKEFLDVLLAQGWTEEKPNPPLGNWNYGAYRQRRFGPYQVSVCAHLYDLTPYRTMELQCTVRLPDDTWIKVLHYGLPHPCSQHTLDKLVRRVVKAATASLETPKKKKSR